MILREPESQGELEWTAQGLKATGRWDGDPTDSEHIQLYSHAKLPQMQVLGFQDSGIPALFGYRVSDQGVFLAHGKLSLAQ